jgi:excisionase family DNA binding protein
MDKIQMVSVKEVSQVLGIGINQAYDLVKKDSFPSLKTGHRYLISKDSFEKWLQENLYK